MKVALVQLSDIHIDEKKSNPILGKAKEISQAIYPLLRGTTHVSLIISGDIAYSGRSQQYELAENFLREIQGMLSAEAGKSVDIFVVPGNHDCDFADEQKSRAANVQYVQSVGSAGVDESVIEACTSVQRGFLDFQARLQSKDVLVVDGLWSERRIALGDTAIVLEGLNVSWVSKMREEPGRLHFPFERYEGRDRSPEDIHVMVMHHPVNWFNQGIYSSFRQFLRHRATLVVSGHEHVGGASEINDIDAGPSIALEGRVLQEHGGNLSNTGFNVLVLDVDVGEYQLTRLDYVNGIYSPREEAFWQGYRSLPKRVDVAAELNIDFQRRITDPGAYLSVANHSPITLSDIYIYPDLLSSKAASTNRIYYNSSKLLDQKEIDCGVVVSGDERSGLSSLLYQLFRHYHSSGKMPLLIDGCEIDSTHSRDLDKLIKRAAAQQYCAGASKAFDQCSRFDKVLLIDNFDDSCIVEARARASILSSLKERFEHIVVTVGPAFDMQEMVDGDVAALIKNMRHFRIQPFGNAKRSQLVRKWFSLDSRGTVDEGTFIGRCHEAERLLGNVVDGSLIPHVPLHLLTLLQSIQIGRSGDLQNSSLSHYYNFLITQGLEAAGVQPDKLDEYYQYCTYLAWRFHEKGASALTAHELKCFNEDFSSDWTTIDFERIIDNLVRARVLQQVGGGFEFRYPYIYFYLKGRYLARELTRPDVADYIASCCDHLYVRDNANTVLFLAHHANSDLVLDNIARVLNELFSDKVPVSFQGDSDDVNQLIFDAPSIVFDEGHSPSKHREKLAQKADDREAKEGPRSLLKETRENGSALSLQAKLIILMKTSEILGQLLKDQYANIKRPKRRQLIEQIYKGNLRALRKFFDSVVSSSSPLIESVKASVIEKGRAESIQAAEAYARRLMSAAIEAISVGLVIRAAQSTTSTELAEDVAKLVADDGTLSYRIIELATLLDSAKDLPRPQLERLYGETDGNLVARRTVIYLVLNRLYMFKTTQSDMQWLHQKLKIDIRFQQKLAYGRGDAKLIA